VEDQTFQPILAKLSDFPTRKLVETNHYGNLFIEKLVETNHFSNSFIEELVKIYTRGLTIDNLIEKRTNCNLSN
jgi:hypothetical protein